MNSLQSTQFKQRRAKFVTNNKGQYYNNQKILIKNYNTTPISNKIDKNMSNLNVDIDSINNMREKNKKINEIIKIINDENYNNDTDDMDNMNNYEDEYKDKPYTRKQINITTKILKLTVDMIENVYQQKYNNNINASGLGDFLRGSYFLMQFCKEHNILYSINLQNHPISHFLYMYQNITQTNNNINNINNINKFEITNHHPVILDNNIITNIYDNTINNDFLNYLTKQKIVNKIIYVYTIAYPTIIIEQEHKEVMKKILSPTYKIIYLTNNILTNLNLIKQKYITIHIRFGDNYLVKTDETIDSEKFNSVTTELNKLDPSLKYLLISDNIIVKKQMVDLFPFIKTHYNKITHTGEGIDLDIVELQNTMIDFYLFSCSTKIIAFSIYPHGSGFSKWCAETYNIPYVCKIIK